MFTKVYTGNEIESFEITDLVENTGIVEVSISRIDKISPVAENVSYSPGTKTNEDVEVTLTTSEVVQTIT